MGEKIGPPQSFARFDRTETARKNSGVAFPGRSEGEVFQVPVRVNTGGAKLGAVDIRWRLGPA